MNKTTWIIALAVAVILGAGLWWWFRATPVTAPTEGLSQPSADQTADAVSQITQDLNGIGIDQLDLQDIDADLNQL